MLYTGDSALPSSAGANDEAARHEQVEAEIVWSDKRLAHRASFDGSMAMRTSAMPFPSTSPYSLSRKDWPAASGISMGQIVSCYPSSGLSPFALTDEAARKARG